MLTLNDEERRLAARAAELSARAATGEITATSYLTPREQLVLAERFAGDPGCFSADGGYAAAERKRFFFLPGYVRDTEEPYRTELLADIRAEKLTAVKIAGSGYRELAHRDYLGAVLNLGVKRESLGDLCVPDAFSAVLFADRTLAAFLTGTLTRVANDAVRVCPFVPPADFDGGRRFLSCSDTIPSPRADAVVAAICNLAREKAQALFREGKVEIAYEPAEKPDRQVCEGDVIVVRGVGKFLIRSLSGQTKKGRYRLQFDRYL